MTQTATIYDRPKTKIVCTLGTQTRSYEMISRLVRAGMSVARLNLSHGSLAEHEAMFQRVRQVSEDLDIPVGIMVDVPGPKYRTGPQSPGDIYLDRGEEIILTSRTVIGSPDMLGVYPPGIHNDVDVGGLILVDDGAIALRALCVTGTEVTCEIERGGKVTERRGVTTPGRAPALPFLDDRAREGLSFAATEGADFVALSNVTVADDVAIARRLLEMDGNDAFIISKIETAEAIVNFDDLLDVSDGIMVARGDMGVEIELERVPVVQKWLINECNRAGKPVITATQMLESMLKSSSPTRAEVTDVANAVYDGSDAVMLSGETAVGDFPDRAVEVMRKVAMNAEDDLPYDRLLRDKASHVEQQTDDAISYDASRIANQLDADLITAFTESGSTARRVSKYRPRPRILALTPHDTVRRKLTLSWGVHPVLLGDGLSNVDEVFEVSKTHAVSSGRPGGVRKIVITAGVPFGVVGSTNLLHVMEIDEDPGQETGRVAERSADYNSEAGTEPRAAADARE